MCCYIAVQCFEAVKPSNCNQGWFELLSQEDFTSKVESGITIVSVGQQSSQRANTKISRVHGWQIDWVQRTVLEISMLPRNNLILLLLTTCSFISGKVVLKCIFCFCKCVLKCILFSFCRGSPQILLLPFSKCSVSVSSNASQVVKKKKNSNAVHTF